MSCNLAVLEMGYKVWRGKKQQEWGKEVQLTKKNMQVEKGPDVSLSIQGTQLQKWTRRNINKQLTSSQ